LKDAKIEVARWKESIRYVNMFIAMVMFFFSSLCLVFFVMDGYTPALNLYGVRPRSNVQLAGIGELVWFSFIGAAFISTGIVLGVAKFYRHPSVLVENEKKRLLLEKEGGMEEIISEGERVTRGTRLRKGAWPDTIALAKKDAVKAQKVYNRDKPLPTIMVSGVPYPFSYENMAMYIQGSAGSGKSQIIKQMIHDIRARNGRDKLIIYDRKPEFLPLFYRDGDIIICPADKRHTPWDIFAEISGEQDMDGVIQSLIPEAPGTDPNEKFWVDSARNAMRGILVYLRNKDRDASNVELVKLLFNNTDPRSLWACLKTDSAAKAFARAIATERGEENKTATSVLATLASYTNSFTRPEILERGWFSIKQWLRDDSPNTWGQAVFLLNPAKYATNYKSYYTVILDLALREMTSLPNDSTRRVWFFIDEFGSLHRLDSIIRLLAEGRSKGAGTVIGTQDKAQVKENYKDRTETLINNCNSKVIARISSYEEAEYFSKTIGEFEIERENRDGSVTFSDNQGLSSQMQADNAPKQREKRLAVLASEIQTLEPLHYFVQFVGEKWFKAGIPYYPWDSMQICPEFIERSPGYFDTRRITEDRDVAA
jgi:hypothetical protein